MKLPKTLAVGVLLAVYGALAASDDSAREREYRDVKFEGVVRGISFGCQIDALCTADVSGTMVVFGAGWPRRPWGTADFGNQNEVLGKKVSVYCRKYLPAGTPEAEAWCSLEGSTSYYIKLSK